jgi:SAM-dependent methyltransferase
LRGRFEDYLGEVSVRGKSFLDVGPATGLISFEAERHGASEVFGFDAASPDNLDILPYQTIPKSSKREGFERMRRAYWYSHKALKSNAKMIYGDIYKLASQVPSVDVVLLAQVLVHLERPIQAIAQAARAAKETLIIVDGSFEDDRPLVVFLGGKGNYYSWYHHSVGFYREFLPMVGFELVSAKMNVYRTNHPHADANSQVWTFVAKRIEHTTVTWT